VTPERLRQIEALFHEARERASSERDVFLARECAGDPDLRREVESLLAQPPAGVFDAPVGALFADLVTSPAQRLTPELLLGPYRIERLLGAGGMGEVYRARDIRLDRDVAIKTLPDGFAADADRVARFRREAKVLASLNHPFIAAIYGLEEIAGISALVMEFARGEDLAHRLTRGALVIDEALAIAKQVADALESAHERAIIHRDLKPANINVSPDGTVKVLDFGLAKAFDATGAASAATISPMVSMQGTRPGVILGTAAYMPPEQAKGKPVDKRADLWSFGCVLFEMITGRPPFEGETISDVLAKIIEHEPDWTALPATTPPAIQKLLRRCLEKDPRRRLDSAAVARLEIEDALSAPASGVAASETIRGGRRRLWALASSTALAAIVGAIAMWAVMRPTRAPAPSVSRFGIALPSTESLAFSINDRDVALSADGTRLVYVAGDRAQLMVRALDRLEAAPEAGIENARAPFLSPDGRWIGYFDRLDEGVTTGPVGSGALKKVSTSGGPSIVMCRLPGASRGASWGADDTILFATSDPSRGLLRIAASGGEPETLTTPDAARGERAHAFPSMLPDGRGVLFTVILRGGLERQVDVLDLKMGKRKMLIPAGGQAQYVDTGHLIYTVGGALWAVRFDLATLNVVGDAVPLSDQVLTLGAADFAIARSGTLVYVPVAGAGARSLVWVTRQGAEEPIAAPPREYVGARLSPDETRAAL
jgi:serine/threonine protein kinase